MQFLDSIVGRFVRGNLLQNAGAAGLFGVLFHLSIRTIEFEFIMFHVMATFASVSALLIYAVGFVQASLLAAIFNTGLLCSITIYRLVFHRCRKFPGPLGAKLTRFYATWLSAKNVQYYKELAKLHAQYGDFVRTGGYPVGDPDEYSKLIMLQDQERLACSAKKPSP